MTLNKKIHLPRPKNGKHCNLPALVAVMLC